MAPIKRLLRGSKIKIQEPHFSKDHEVFWSTIDPRSVAV
jgi:hypothetical protein